MNVCRDCEKVVVEDGMVFVCDCGVSFVLTYLERYPTYILVQPEIGLPLPGTSPVLVQTNTTMLVA